MMRYKVVRRSLSAAMGVGVVASFVVLYTVGRKGAICQCNMTAAIKYILNFYLPALGTLLGFYLSEDRRSGKDTDYTTTERFLFVLALVIAWVSIPPGVLYLTPYIEDSLKRLDAFGYFSFFPTTALTFYFSKTNKGISRVK